MTAAHVPEKAFRPADAAPTHPLGRVLSPPQFWALMEHWKVPDERALELIEFPGKMSRSGKRPRFRFVSRQQRMTSYLAEVDAALGHAGHDPGWLHRKGRTPPFDGCSPIDVMVRDGIEGADAVLRVLHRAALRKALTA